MKHVGNDTVGGRRQTLDRVTRRSPDLPGPWTHQEGEHLWLREKSLCPPPHRVWLASHKFQLPDVGQKSCTVTLFDFATIEIFSNETGEGHDRP
jgi:hypothetical protein